MRIRSIKPEFWKSEDIARLPHRTRLTFIALWSYVDDNGVGRDVPQLIAGEVFALEPDPREALANVREDLARLSEEGRITRYTVDGKPFLSITNWNRHQRIDKPNKPRYVGPDDPSAVLTCGYGESREVPATPSRLSRETPAPGAVEVGTGEQGNRGELHPSPLRGDAEPHGFAEFWNTYPRRVGKQDAIKAYRKALTKTDAITILAGAQAYAYDPNREPEFTAHPATWLNRGGWEDEPLPTRGLHAVPSRVQEQDALLRGWHEQAVAGQMPELGA